MSDNAVLSRVDKIAATAMLKLRGDACWTSARAMFLLSTGRTGTETLARLLQLSPEIMAFHEPRPQLLAERKLAFERVWSSPHEFEKIFRSSRRRLVTCAVVRRKNYAETSARLTFFAPVITHLMPRARFIHLFRHPADVVRSGMRRGWYENHPADPHRITPVPKSEAADCWQSWTRFEKICWYWAAYHEFALQFAAASPSARVLAVRSEDLFSADTGKWQEVFQHLEVSPPPSDEVRSLLAVRHNVQVAGEFPDFDRWTTTQREILERHAGATMRKLGLA